MSIGENIKKIRLLKGLTQKQLGELCGMADSAIRRYESGRANPKLETIKKIAAALNVSLSDIINEDFIIYNFTKGAEHVEDINMRITDHAEYILINFYRQLNVTGKLEAYKRLGELTLIPGYCESDFKERIKYTYKPETDT